MAFTVAHYATGLFVHQKTESIMPWTLNLSRDLGPHAATFLVKEEVIQAFSWYNIRTQPFGECVGISACRECRVVDNMEFVRNILRCRNCHAPSAVDVKPQSPALPLGFSYDQEEYTSVPNAPEWKSRTAQLGYFALSAVVLTILIWFAQLSRRHACRADRSSRHFGRC